jgi:hypothetical protein
VGGAPSAAGIETTEDGAPPTHFACFLRKHPARGDEALSPPNPFVLANRHFEAMGAHPVLW